MFRRTVVQDAPAASTQATYQQAVVRDTVFDPNRIIALVAGFGFVLLGALVLIDTGIAGFPDTPVTTVFGFTQTPLLGALDVVAGLLLLAAAWDRSFSVFIGALLLLGGIIQVSSGDRLPASLQANSAYGWMLIIVAAVVLIVALALPTARVRRREVTDGVV
jgi:hypothetical protein